MFKPNLFAHSFFITSVSLCLTLLLFSPLQAQPTIERECILSEYAPGGHAIWLNQIPGDTTRDYLFASPGGIATLYSNGTALISGQIINKSDANRRWDVNIALINQMDYNQWTANGGQLKNGGGANLTEQQSWIFFELDSTESYFSGTPGSAFDGDTIYLAHMPSNLQFGFQVGTGANDKTMDFGVSGWFYFSGSYSGRGDINANISCDSVVIPPPPPVCDVVLDTFYAACKTDSTFELIVTFRGSGSNYQITDDQGSSPASGLAPGTHSYGEYFNSTDVVITVSDPNFPNCEDASLPVTQDCTPVPMCDLVVDTVFTQCTSDSTFTINVSFQGTGSQFQLFDDRGTASMVGLSAGTYTYGSYHQDSVVNLTVLDFAIFNCFAVLGPLSDSCSADSSSSGTMVAGFQAQPISGGIYLDWYTTEEFQNEGFTVERSTDGFIYESIGWVSGSFNSSRTINYDFIDYDAGAGIQYHYRLKQLRTDGKFSYSSAKKALLAREYRVALNPIAPNPVRGSASLVAISAEDGIALNCQMIDGMGRIRSKENIRLRKGRQELNIDCTQVQTGVYIMKFMVDQEVIATQRILVFE